MWYLWLRFGLWMVIIYCTILAEKVWQSVFRERGLLSESLQIFRNITSCIRSWVFRHFFRCPFGNNCSPAISAFRSDINYIISGLDHVQIVFNYNNCISTIRKSSQNLHQFLNVCKGKRYNRETLEVKYKDKSIYDVLNMTVEEAMTFFENVPSIRM